MMHYCTNHTPFERAKLQYCTTGSGGLFTTHPDYIAAFTLQHPLLFYRIFSYSFSLENLYKNLRLFTKRCLLDPQYVTSVLLTENVARGDKLQGCHKLGFYPSSRIFNTCQSYSDGFVEVFGFLALGADANRHLHTRVYVRAYV